MINGFNVMFQFVMFLGILAVVAYFILIVAMITAAFLKGSIADSEFVSDEMDNTMYVQVNGEVRVDG